MFTLAQLLWMVPIQIYMLEKHLESETEKRHVHGWEKFAPALPSLYYLAQLESCWGRFTTFSGPACLYVMRRGT